MSNLARIAYDTRTSRALMNEGCTIEAMSAIWRRALNRVSIGPDENFFELGGTPQMASELLQQIAKQFGRELPDFVIFQAPTIREMVAILADPQPPRCAPLSRLKQGSNRVAIFMAHGMGGDASQLFEIARGLQVINPIYATQPHAIDGRNKPFDRIEDMAATYLKAIREVQPNGPYLLIGYSLGGLVMMEAAQHLLNQGERIEL